MRILQPAIDLTDSSLQTHMDYMQDIASSPDFQYTEVSELRSHFQGCS